MNVYYLLPLLLVVLAWIPGADAAVEHGKDFDKEIISINPDGTRTVKHTVLNYERVNHLGAWHDYVYTDYGSYLEIKTATNTIRLDVVTCGFSFYNKDNVKLFNDSIVAYNSIVNQYTWNAVTQVNGAACEAYHNISEKSLVAKRYAAGIGYMEYKYIFKDGSWKTQLEATNLTSLTNRVFAFDQTIDLNRDTIKFGSQQRNLDNFNGTTFVRDWLEFNKANVIDFLNNFSFDLDIGFKYLDSVTVTDTGENKSKITFHYMRNNEVLLPNQTLIIDPTYSTTNPTEDGFIESNTALGAACSGTASSRSSGAAAMNINKVPAASNTRCQVAYVEWPISSIPDSSIITDVDVIFDVASSSLAGTAQINHMASQPSVSTDQAVYDDAMDGTAYLSNSTFSQSAGDNKSLDLGANADANVQSQLTGGDWFAVGIWFESDTRDGDDQIFTIATEESGTATPKPTLEVTYNVANPPDAVDDLTSPAQSYGTVDLLWTEPELNGGNASGYQINYTTPFGNPNTVLTNNTETTTTTSTVSGLELGTDYTFGVSVWTEGGNNATHPPMYWLNVTTEGNFTIGTALFNQTNSEVLPITFEEQDINSTAKFLNVTYANTFTLNCDFSYQFANDNRTYSNLTGTAVSTTLDETYFILTDFEDEIINVNCYDSATGTDADYLLVQSDFPLLEQIRNFRNGTYGTMGLFGVFDLVTIAVVIFSMIGLNRVNESVGAIFNIILLGSLAYFEIIELPTIIFGALTVVIVFVITSTRKD